MTTDDAGATLTAKDLRKILRDFKKARSPEERYDIALALGDIYLELDPPKAVGWYEKALIEYPTDTEAMGGRAEALFELWRFAEAESSCRDALSRDAKSPRAHFVNAMLCERKRQDGETKTHYLAAKEGDPERFSMPFRLSRAKFQEVVSESLRAVPKPVQKLLEGVTVVVEDFPPSTRKDEFQRSGLAPTVLGLFEGTPPLERPHDAPPDLPPRITLFQRNLERTAADREDLLVEIARTTLHEVGHLAGMEEGDLEDAGYD